MNIHRIEHRPDPASWGAGRLPVMPDIPGDKAPVTGYWICDLATQGLRWTGAVFDLFGLPRNIRPDRRATVEMYCDQSREEMEWLRAEAIALRRGFTIDAEIQRPDGARRIMRLTARVYCREGRTTHLFGTKLDITTARAHAGIRDAML